LLDIFTGDAFGVISLTSSMEILPVMPTRLSELGLFSEEGVSTTTVGIEFRNGSLSLIPTQPRGTMPEYGRDEKRIVRTFAIPHIPKNGSIKAEEVQNLRAFGSNDSTQAVAAVVNTKLTGLKQDHEFTAEWHKMGALRGVLLDADGTTVIYNIFNEFGISETNVNFPMATANGVATAARTVGRNMRTALGQLTYRSLRALCSPSFFESFINSVDVKAAYDKWQDGQFFRDEQRKGFLYQGIYWEEFDASVGATPYVPVNNCRFIAEGVPGLFKRYNAPADFMETVNTVGKAYYAKQEPQRFGKGVDLHTQSNPLHICVRPQTLIRGTAT
jgi:hypothetical protein